MGVCIAILIEHDERDRHIMGITQGILPQLKRQIDSIYILYDNVHPDPGEVRKSNALYLEKTISHLFPVCLRGFNPTDTVNVVQELTYISRKESSSELLIDVTNSTQEFYLVASAFSKLFGSCIYFVALEKQEGQESTILKMIPLKTKLPIKLKEEHEKILINLLEKGPADSIIQLSQNLGMKNKKGLATLTYRIRQLGKWGFVVAKGTREVAISLSDLGKGYAMGILELQKERPESNHIKSL